MHFHPILKGALLYHMLKYIRAFALCFFLFICTVSSSFAATSGPASSYDELSALLRNASDGDTILVAGRIDASSTTPLTSQSIVYIQSEGEAAISSLCLHDASIVFSNVTFTDGISITGNSHIQLGKHVSVSGAFQKPSLSFSGSGTLIIENGCSIKGDHGSAGVLINHHGGEFYGSIEGRIWGGDGSTGGTGLAVTSLQNDAAMMITGTIEGGLGEGMGGHALTLYGLSGNAHITIDGHLQGGSGSIGGDAIQIVSISDIVNVGISGQAKGGSGESHGGNALILMNAQDASSFHISGHFSGGNAIADGSVPGTSLRLVGNAVAARTRIENCILEDGKPFRHTGSPSPSPSASPAQ